ncbi:Hsp20/alpha crystallin family protein [Mycolicibacterium mengxianglii]|uniref:Hsp20/alpha crystallin family protein n=1 Tax=Mycolicibacterium mengxianglii TaxID=2736649 RepID=UPI0018D0A233|nr:Hsp20/alpha crystallin family protein [Mycolicibacterium mengxianglii]
MSNLPAQQHRSFWPEITDLFAGLPSWGNLGSALGKHPIKVEDEIKDGKYQLQAEIPGVDPDKDVDVTVSDGILTIKAERSETTEQNGRSEFSYGSFIRSVRLPAGADDEGIKASYEKGILKISVPLKDSEVAAKRIAIESSK